MGIAAITPHTLTLLAGDEQRIQHGGSEIVVWEIQGGSKVNISLDGQADLPAAAGRGFRQQHSHVIVKNPNATTVVVTILQSTEPNSFIDNLDTATTVQIGENPQVVNSPSTDEGGNVHPWPTSGYNGLLDAAAGQLQADIVTAAANTNGIRVRYGKLRVLTAAAGKYSWVDANTPQRMLMIADAGQDNLDGEFDIQPGTALRYTVQQGMKVVVAVHYEIL